MNPFNLSVKNILTKNYYFCSQFFFEQTKMVYIKTTAVNSVQGVQKRVTTQEYLQGIGASHPKAPSKYTKSPKLQVHVHTIERFLPPIMIAIHKSCLFGF